MIEQKIYSDIISTLLILNCFGFSANFCWILSRIFFVGSRPGTSGRDTKLYVATNILLVQDDKHKSVPERILKCNLGLNLHVWQILRTAKV